MNTDKANGQEILSGVDHRTRLPLAIAQLLFADITGDIIGAAYAVHNALGSGLLEKVYENALAWELHLRDRAVAVQQPFRVMYREKNVGDYCSDMVVDGKVIVEVKAVKALDDAHRAQLLNYLRISGLRVGLLINFGPTRIEYERLVV